MRLKEDSSKPDIEPFKKAEPDIICNKLKATEEGILLDNKIIISPESEKLLIDEESMLGIDLNKALAPTMREEVSQEETAEITGNHSGHEEVCRISGHAEIPDTTDDEGYCRRMVTQTNEDVITSSSTFRRTIKKDHVIEASIEVPIQPRGKLIMDSSADADAIGIEDQGIIDYGYGTWLEELLQPDKKLLDTEIDTEQAENEQTEQKTGGHTHQRPPGNKASTAHLHFPFQNVDVPICEN
tara:strand:- start:510 stop:1232 length:723 start_codon:yes stop_codon:yes gene_type:complete